MQILTMAFSWQSPFRRYIRSVRNFYNQITDFLAVRSGRKRKTIFAEAGRSKVDRFYWDSMWCDPSSSLERTTAKASLVPERTLLHHVHRCSDPRTSPRRLSFWLSEFSYVYKHLLRTSFCVSLLPFWTNWTISCCTFSSYLSSCRIKF